MTLNRWPASHTKRAPQKVHPLPQRLQNSRVFTPPPVKLLRGVHPPVTQLRAIDMAPVLLRAERDAPVEVTHPHVCGSCNASVPRGRVCCDNVVSRAEPAPVAAPQPAGARFVVGQRVRCIAGARGLARGSEHVIRGIDYDSGAAPYLLLEGDENDGGWLLDRFEPLPSETPERGDWIPPAPWMRVSIGDSEARYYGHGSASLFDRRVARIDNCNKVNGVTRWRAFPPEAQMCIGFYPSAALACCAALGIEIVQGQNSGLWLAAREGDLLACLDDQCRDAEQAARRALAALHARGMR